MKLAYARQLRLAGGRSAENGPNPLRPSQIQESAVLPHLNSPRPHGLYVIYYGPP